jgi:hypothetical protein
MTTTTLMEERKTYFLFILPAYGICNLIMAQAAYQHNPLLLIDSTCILYLKEWGKKSFLSPGDYVIRKLGGGHRSKTRVNICYAERTARLSKASTCTTERRKTSREEREAANKASLSEKV